MSQPRRGGLAETSGNFGSLNFLLVPVHSAFLSFEQEAWPYTSPRTGIVLQQLIKAGVTDGGGFQKLLQSGSRTEWTLAKKTRKRTLTTMMNFILEQDNRSGQTEFLLLTRPPFYTPKSAPLFL